MEKLLKHNKRNVVFCVSCIIFTKKTQGISSKLFVLGRDFSNFFPTASSTLRSFPTLLALDFPQLPDALRKRLTFQINVRQNLKKTTEWVVRFILFLDYLPIHISFLQYKFSILDVIIVFEID